MTAHARGSADRDRKERLSVLYEKYGKKMFSAAKKIVGRDADADARSYELVRIEK